MEKISLSLLLLLLEIIAIKLREGAANFNPCYVIGQSDVSELRFLKRRTLLLRLQMKD